MNTRQKYISWVVGIVASVVGIWVALNPWHYIGWTTPHQHNRDYSKVDEFRDEWKCDEYSEEIPKMVRSVKRAKDKGEDTVEQEERLATLRDKMKRMDCQRFDDFG